MPKYLTKAGGRLHLSNPIFPRSFPKVILIDRCYAMVGSACLDTTTFEQYRDYVYVTNNSGVIENLFNLFDNDWHYSAKPGAAFPAYNPTPVIRQRHLIIGPVNATDQLVTFFQSACSRLDVTTELLGNLTLESELFAALSRGVRVRLISPELVNGATADEQDLQMASLTALKAAGVHVHVTRPPESSIHPYMHARLAVVDGKKAYLGSVSFSPDSSTINREVGLILDYKCVVERMQKQFDIDYATKSCEF